MRYRYRIEYVIDGIQHNECPPKIAWKVFPNGNWATVETLGSICDVYFEERQTPILFGGLVLVEETDMSTVVPEPQPEPQPEPEHGSVGEQPVD